MKMANSLQERLKLKQYQVDTWTPKEQLCLASAVMRSGDQNWVAVSRTIKTLTTETNRPLDWYSTKNCALMYAKLLEKVDTPKRKRERGESISTNIETPGEIVTKMLAKQRIEELRVLEAQSRTSYNHLRQQIQHLEAGMLDHTLDAEWEAFVRERKEEEEKERLHREWLKQREEKIHAIQKALKHQIPKVPISSSSLGLNKKKVGERPSWPSSSSSERRDSGMSDNSELDAALDSPGVSSPMVEESQQSETETKPVPTSPLLSSLLSKPPNPPSNSNVAADLRQSFNLSSSRGRVGLSPNVSSALQNLVSSAISGTDATQRDHQKSTSTSPGSAAPTLSRLLELPPRPPGDPMPSITDLPPTHAETMAQVHKGSPPELKKAKLDIEVLAAEAAESFLSDSLLNDLDDQLDDEGMDEEEDDAKDDDISSVTPPEAVPHEGGKIRDQHAVMEMRGTILSSPLKIHGGKADPQKCIYDVSGSESSPETDTDLPLEEDKKGEETEPQVGDKRKEDKEEEKEEKFMNNLPEHEVIDKEKVNKKEREEIYKIKNAVVEIIKDKKIENMVKKSESYNSEDREDEKEKDISEKTNNENGEEKRNDRNDNTSKDEKKSKVESVEKGDRKRDSSSHKRKSEGKDDKDKYRRSDKKKDKKSDRDHKRSKKSKKYKHKDKTESEKDESEKESKSKEKRSDKEKSRDKKSEKEKEKEKTKSKDKRRESRSEKGKLKDKKEVDKNDKYKKNTKKDKDEISERKHDRHKSKHESEIIKSKGDDSISKSESDREKDYENGRDLSKEKRSKSKMTPDFQGEANKNEKLDKNKKAEVEKEVNNCMEGVEEIKKSEVQDKNQSNELCKKGEEKHLSGSVDTKSDSSILKTEKLESSNSVSYADKVKISKNDIESNPIEDCMDEKEGKKIVDIISKDVGEEINLDLKNVEKQKSILIDEEIERKENNCNVNNTGNNENEKQKSNKTRILDQNNLKEIIRDADSITKSKHDEKLNKSSEVCDKPISNQEKAVSCKSDGDMSDSLDDMNLKERKKKVSGGFGKADAFSVVDSPLDDLDQTEDIKFMDDDSMDSSKNKNDKEDISDIIIKKTLGEERLEHNVKLEKTETNVMSLDISELLKKEDNDVRGQKSLKDDTEIKENELEEMLSKLDDEDKESPVVEKRGRKKKKVVDLDDEFLNDDSRDAMSEEEMIHARGGKRKSSGSDLFAVASPFVPESNPCSPASTLWGDENDAEKAYRAWKKPIMILWNEIAAHKFASVFLRPITDEMAPGYHDVIHRPMDLKSIKTRIENGTITSTSEFQRDMMLMFLNATMYNTSDHNVYQMATRMMKDTVSSIEEFRTTQMLARASDTPIKSLRRETRESSAKRGDDDPKRKGFETPEIKKRRFCQRMLGKLFEEIQIILKKSNGRKIM